MNRECSRKKTQIEKKKKNINKELVRSLKETNEEGNVTLDEIVEQVASLKDAISIINKYEEIFKMQKHKIIFLEFKPRYILKKFKNTEHISEIGSRQQV